MEERGHVGTGNPMYFRVREVIANAVDHVHALDDVPDGTESDNEKFGHACWVFCRENKKNTGSTIVKIRIFVWCKK